MINLSGKVNNVAQFLRNFDFLSVFVQNSNGINVIYNFSVFNGRA